mmetsp:Transcript_20707/g.57837  ORF Transcript_20707/g.57837 Transcript_20707/m.57837 type:complete len:402 (-) Transcript_20707:325-1530(-)
MQSAEVFDQRIQGCGLQLDVRRMLRHGRLGKRHRSLERIARLRLDLLGPLNAARQGAHALCLQDRVADMTAHCVFDQAHALDFGEGQQARPAIPDEARHAFDACELYSLVSGVGSHDVRRGRNDARFHEGERQPGAVAHGKVLRETEPARRSRGVRLSFFGGGANPLRHELGFHDLVRDELQNHFQRHVEQSGPVARGHQDDPRERPKTLSNAQSLRGAGICAFLRLWAHLRGDDTGHRLARLRPKLLGAAALRHRPNEHCQEAGVCSEAAEGAFGRISHVADRAYRGELQSILVGMNRHSAKDLWQHTVVLANSLRVGIRQGRQCAERFGRFHHRRFISSEVLDHCVQAVLVEGLRRSRWQTPRFHPHRRRGNGNWRTLASFAVRRSAPQAFVCRRRDSC